MSDGNFWRFMKQVQRGVNTLRSMKGKGLLVIHHDTDGLTSGYIMSKFMEKLGLDFDIKVVPFISHVNINDISPDYDYYVFSDIGAGQQEIIERQIGDKPVVIFDHHPYECRVKDYTVVNPVDFGFDSQSDLCAAGLAYIAYRTAMGFDEKMLWIAITGTIGDVQDADNNTKGINRKVLLADAEKRSEYIFYDEFMPRAPKMFIVPIWYTITYNYILKVSGYYLNRNATIEALARAGVPPTKHYHELTTSEKIAYVSWINKQLEKNSIPKIGKFGEFLNAQYYPDSKCINEDECFILYHARTFAQYINLAGRLGKYFDVFRVFETMNASRLIEIEFESRDLRQRIKEKLKNIEVIHTDVADIVIIDSDIPPEFSGIVANMVSNGKIGIAAIRGNGYYKVSGRAGSRSQIHIGNLFHEIAERLNTDGGGHESAGGIVLPIDKTEEFIDILQHLDETHIKNDVKMTK